MLKALGQGLGMLGWVGDDRMGISAESSVQFEKTLFYSDAATTTC